MHNTRNIACKQETFNGTADSKQAFTVKSKNSKGATHAPETKHVKRTKQIFKSIEAVNQRQKSAEHTQNADGR